jgi:hypothetical protein
VRIPEEYIMAGRMNILLRGMGKAFGLQLRMGEMWRHEAAAFLTQHGITY